MSQGQLPQQQQPGSQQQHATQVTAHQDLQAQQQQQFVAEFAKLTRDFPTAAELAHLGYADAAVRMATQESRSSFARELIIGGATLDVIRSSECSS